MSPLALLLPAALAAEPHASYPRLVSSNGHGVLVFTADAAQDRARLDAFSDHLYQKPSPAAEDTRDLLYDAYFGLRTSSDPTAVPWRNDASSASYTYLPATGILQVGRSRPGEALQVTEYAFVPMDLPWPGYVHLLHLHNPSTSTETVEVVEAFSLHNLHLGEAREGGGLYGQERLALASGGFVEQGQTTGLGVRYVSLAGNPVVGCEDLYATVLAGGDLPNACQTTGDDRVGGMQWDLGALRPGEHAWIGVASVFFSGDDAEVEAVAALDAWRAGRGPEALLAAEQSWWQGWLAEATATPADASAEERAVWDQALVALKMGQVREEGPPHGQILASLPAAAPVGDFQHLWNITWVRDSAYAIRALTAAGYLEEARAALAFQIQEGCCGQYADLLPVEGYALSVCRYYGDGTEWSDDDGTGPNVELDGFGLYLWALAEYVEASGDDAFVADHGERVFGGIADVLVEAVEPELGLVMADSSIWERHWYGREKHFTYTSAWAARGLRAAADLAARQGDPDREALYRATADQIAAGIEANLLDGEVLAGNLEELQAGGDYLDAAAVEAFNMDVLDPRGPEALASLEAWEAFLGVESGPGLARNDDGDLYDRQEWVMIDLRVAEAWRRACRPERAAVLEDWLAEHAALNNDILPELLDPETADYAGPAPMMGFGSGLYVLHLLQRPDLGEGCLPTPEDSGTADSDDPDDSGGDPAAEGCGCASGGPGGGGLVVLLAAGLARRRRR